MYAYNKDFEGIVFPPRFMGEVGGGVKYNIFLETVGNFWQK